MMWAPGCSLLPGCADNLVYGTRTVQRNRFICAALWALLLGAGGC